MDSRWSCVSNLSLYGPSTSDSTGTGRHHIGWSSWSNGISRDFSSIVVARVCTGTTIDTVGRFPPHFFWFQVGVFMIGFGWQSSTYNLAADNVDQWIL